MKTKIFSKGSRPIPEFQKTSLLRFLPFNCFFLAGVGLSTSKEGANILS
jgi:hypothetical protein